MFEAADAVGADDNEIGRQRAARSRILFAGRAALDDHLEVERSRWLKARPHLFAKCPEVVIGQHRRRSDSSQREVGGRNDERIAHVQRRDLGLVPPRHQHRVVNGVARNIRQIDWTQDLIDFAHDFLDAANPARARIHQSICKTAAQTRHTPASRGPGGRVARLLVFQIADGAPSLRTVPRLSGTTRPGGGDLPSPRGPARRSRDYPLPARARAQPERAPVPSGVRLWTCSFLVSACRRRVIASLGHRQDCR